MMNGSGSGKSIVVFVLFAACGQPATTSIDAMPDAPIVPAYANTATLTLPMPTKSALFGSTVGVSADGHTIAVASVGMGGVFVFVDGPDGWSQEASLRATISHPGDGFGGGVALSGSGDTLVVGASLESSAATGVDGNANDRTASHAGAAYVFKRQNGSWAQQAYLKASNTAAGDYFGSPVAISNDGNTIAIGATAEASGVPSNPLDNSATFAGAAYVFTTDGTTWAQQAYLKASNVDANDRFGFELALSADGSTIVVGAPGESSAATGSDGDPSDNSAPGAGATYVFRRSGGAWAQATYLKSSRSTPGGNFGSRIALSGLGTTLAVSASSESLMDPGGNVVSDVGAAYVFAFDGTRWTQTAVLEPATPEAQDQFGVTAISADGAILAAGARGAAMFTGAATAYADTTGTWQPFAQPSPAMPALGDQLGVDVVLSHDGRVLVASAPLADVGATDTGKVYVFY